MSSSSSSNEMLVIASSRECSLPGCHTHDFLPIQCPGCHLPFCLSHHSPFLLSSSSTYHPCASPPPNRTPLPCPLCSSPISTPPGQDPNLSMDAHLGSAECVERGRVQGMGEAGERELRRLKRRRGEMCWVGSCRKVTKGGLGVKCETCLHTHCLPHRTPSSHSCKPPSLSPTTTSSSKSKPKPQTSSFQPPAARKTPLSLSSASTNAGLAALRRQAAEGVKGVREDGEKAVGGLKGFGQKGVAARRTKAETASREKSLAERARLGLLSESEKVEWESTQLARGSGRRTSSGGKDKKEKKEGCWVA